MRLRTFGGLSIEGAPQELGGAAGQRRPLALLLLLAAAGERGVSRDKLLGLLWPESDEEHARGALRQTLHALRRDLGAPELFVGGTEVRLNAALLPSDVAEFDAAVERGGVEARERAVELYAGPLADGFLLGKAPEFERWLDAERQLRARRFAEVCEAVAREAAHRGDHRRAVTLWEKLATQERLSSRVALELMRALVAAGDRPAAIKHARVYEALVRAELDAPPDPEVVALADRLRNEVAYAPPQPAAPPRRVAEPAPLGPVGVRRSAPTSGGAARAAADAAPEAASRPAPRWPASEPPPVAPRAPDAEVRLRTYDETHGAHANGAVAPGSGFDSVLETPRTTERSRALTGGRRVPSLRVALYVAAAVLGVGLVARQAMLRATPSTDVDHSLYLVLPFRADGDSARIGLTGDQVERELYEAISRWEDVRPVDALRVEDMLARRGVPASLREALDAARSFKAGYLVWGALSRFRDTIRVQASLYDVAQQDSTRSEIAHIPATLSDIQARFRQLADSLLMGRTRVPPVMPAGGGPTRLAAWRAYHRGYAALQQWKLDEAANELRAATTIDPGFAQAWFWLAQATNWLREDLTDEGRRAAIRAVELRHLLSPRDQVAAAALAALAADEHPTACARYRELLRRDSADFAAWYGLGECQARDSLVVTDPRSPSGWSFRASYHSAIDAYVRALDLVPSFHLAFRDRAYARLASMLFTAPWRVRYGIGVKGGGDTLVLAAWPALEKDTLAFVPYPIDAFRAGRPGTNPPTRASALAQNRILLRRITETWVASFPKSADALEAQALALEALGEVAPAGGRKGALSTARRAREMVPAADTEHRVRLAAIEVRLLVKSDSLGRARNLADSMLALAARAVAPHDTVLAALAALTGRISRAATLLAHGAATYTPATPGAEPVAVPSNATAAAQRLAVFAAFGGPADTLRALEARVERLVRAQVEPQRQPRVRSALLYMPLRFAYAELAARSSLPPQVADDRLIRMYQALERGDHAAIRAQLEAVGTWRATLAAGELSPEVLLQEIMLRTRIRDTASAVLALDQMLEAIPSMTAPGLRHPFGAAALVRAMALRAELAAAAGDRPTARRWSRAVLTLWSDADAFLRPVTARMRDIAGATS